MIVSQSQNDEDANDSCTNPDSPRDPFYKPNGVESGSPYCGSLHAVCARGDAVSCGDAVAAALSHDHAPIAATPRSPDENAQCNCECALCLRRGTHYSKSHAREGNTCARSDIQNVGR